jgi:hypothetical protein
MCNPFIFSHRSLKKLRGLEELVLLLDVAKAHYREVKWPSRPSSYLRPDCPRSTCVTSGVLSSSITTLLRRILGPSPYVHCKSASLPSRTETPPQPTSIAHKLDHPIGQTIADVDFQLDETQATAPQLKHELVLTAPFIERRAAVRRRVCLGVGTRRGDRGE